MTHTEWSTYVDTGNVPHYFIIEIVERMKTFQPLLPKHLQVYITHSSIIETLIKTNSI
jgi:hypothetical protein